MDQESSKEPYVEGAKDIKSWRKPELCSARVGPCHCRKCSLMSLGDVEPREVHSMIRFIKQNKVASSHVLLEVNCR